MYCKNCNEPVEEGASYCGNCGAAVSLGHSGASSSTPSYALALPADHSGELQAVLSVVFGALGLAGSMMLAFVGLSLGMAGIVAATISRSYVKRKASTCGLILSSIAVLVSLGSWAYAVRQDPRFNPDVSRVKPANSVSAVSSGLSTSCYEANFIDVLNISKTDDSCNANAYNGKTLETSTNLYKVFASKTQVSNVNDFMTVAKQAIQKDVAANLPGFTIKSQAVSAFAGSPAYVMTLEDQAHKASLVEAAVYHPTASGDNTFILVHANNGPSADLQILESQWQWK